MFPPRAHSSLAIFIAFSVAFLLLGFLWLLNPASTTRAQSQPEALGSLSGVVRNAQGDPLPNITVSLEHYQDLYAPRQVTSNAQGVYEFFSVFSGNYVLRFEDNGPEYATSFYTNALFAEDAEIISVNGNAVTEINMQLQVGGALSVTLQDALALTGTTYSLRLYRQTAHAQWVAIRSAASDYGENRIRIGNLPSGTYRLCVDSQNQIVNTHGAECYNNILPNHYTELAPTSSDILVQAGQETLVAMTVNDLTQVKGYILAPNDQPLANIAVALRYYYNLGSYPDHFARSDETGYFRFGFIEGNDYSLIYNFAPDGRNPYLKGYYPDEFVSINAAKLTIDGSTHFSITKKLTLGASIIGKVTLPNDVPINQASVGVYRLREDNSWSEPGDCYEDCPFINYDNVTGVYTVTQLPAGRFRLRADTYVPNSQTTLSGFYGGNSFETADDIELALGETRVNVNFVLGGSEFNSAIAGVVTANGTPQEGIEVGLFSYFAPPSDTSTLPIVQTKTDAQGRYILEGLTIGRYSVGFHDPAGIYATAFYTDPALDSNYDNVFITQTGTLPNINMQLYPGGSIRGYVRTEPGQQPGGYRVYVLQTINGIYYATALRYIDERTDADGYFEIMGLPPGTYALRADTPLNYSTYPYSLYRYYPAADDIIKAKLITVKAGKVEEGRNIYFSAQPFNYLPSINGAGAVPSAPLFRSNTDAASNTLKIATSCSL